MIKPNGKYYDLHIHSIYSIDGITSPKQIIKQALKKGLSGVAVTDHNTITGAIKTSEIAREMNANIEVIIGSEIKTSSGEVIGLFLNEEIDGFKKPIADVLDNIKAQGGLAIVPHPFDPFRNGLLRRDGINLEEIDAIEVFNSRIVNDGWNEDALKFAIKHKKAFCGGSDAHTPQEIGNGLTIVKNDLRNEIKNRKTSYWGIKSPTYLRMITTTVKKWRKLWGYKHDTISSNKHSP